MKKYTTEELQQQFAKHGYKWMPFMLIGVRSRADEPNKFDDHLYLIVNGRIDNVFAITTNPGTTYLQKLLNPKGAAVMKPGQYVNSWGFGLHRGKYQALVQIRPVTVWRDGDKDIKSEKGVEDTGLFGINIHRANTGITQLINGHSAGCQVFQDSRDFDYVMIACRNSGQKQFTYTIMEEF